MKQSLCLSSLAILCVFVTGCPYYDYTVELKPKADGTIERTLTFFQADGGGAGATNYEELTKVRYALIASVYPAGSVTTNGPRYVASADFAGSMPADVGGVGSYTNFATSLGDGGFYMERFRGSNDLAGEMARRLQAADEIDDLIIGWSKMQFGHEHGYKNLRKFLDEDFRQDLKNAGIYGWAGEANDLYLTNFPNEFVFRFSQYLYERGYLKLSDARDIYLAAENEADTSTVVQHLAKRLLMEKMGIPASDPVPRSFAVVDDSAVLQKSWEKYLAGTELYRKQVAKWQKAKKTDPKAAEPQPGDAADELVATLFLGGTGDPFSSKPDHLTVRLALTHAPDFTNGKWQDGHVIWSADLDSTRPLPVVCYAGWSSPNTQFQTEHFGSVILDNAALSQYCYWQGSLGVDQARQWESFVASLKPGSDLKKSLQDFHFTGEATPEKITGKQNYNYTGRKLLLASLENGK